MAIGFGGERGSFVHLLCIVPIFGFGRSMLGNGGLMLGPSRLKKEIPSSRRIDCCSLHLKIPSFRVVVAVLKFLPLFWPSSAFEITC